MTARVSKLSIAGLAIVGSIGLGATSASAQAIYVDPYVQPYPVVVAPSPYVAPAPIVRERTIVVGRPAYTAAPTYRFGAPIAPYGYAGYNYPRYNYPGYSYASDVVDSDW